MSPKQTFYNLEAHKREKILLVAEKEFIEYGFDLASIQRIVEKSDISRGSFYQYFESKDDLFFEILNKYAEIQIVMQGNLKERWREMKFYDIIDVLVEVGFGTVKAYPHAIEIGKQMYTSKTLNQEKLMHFIHSCYRRMFNTENFYGALVRQGIKNKEIVSDVPEKMIVLYMHNFFRMLDEMVLQGVFGKIESSAAKKNTKKMITLLQHGLGGGNK